MAKWATVWEPLMGHDKFICPTREAAHPTVTDFIKLQTPDESIPIGFTDQKVSGRAGLLPFAHVPLRLEP